MSNLKAGSPKITWVLNQRDHWENTERRLIHKRSLWFHKWTQVHTLGSIEQIIFSFGEETYASQLQRSLNIWFPAKVDHKGHLHLISSHPVGKENSCWYTWHWVQKLLRCWDVKMNGSRGSRGHNLVACATN